MRLIEDEGIVIGKIDYGDSDRIINVFFKEYGLISFFLKGIKKSVKRDKEAVELFSQTKFIFMEKNMKYIVKDFDTIDYFYNLKINMDRLNIGFYILQTLDKILVEGEKREKFYELLKNSLEYLDKKFEPKESYLLILYFLYRIIVGEGIKFSISGENYFDIENSRITNEKSGRKLSKEEYKIIGTSIKNIKNLKSENNELRDILSVIKLYESYLNYHLDINLNLKNCFLEA
ncbi:DNA replication and repair protein RecO [Cetobacterium ceti]|uniref:DNA repair protein RecO n=1 Tax=Cetobacterium ceti TaxID=180163 RepID=A0A1T4JYQ1_9FUSO|nr:DNA repair protein RecO [Cetobacterium ceti]SJZ35177.1 DNA replication and repair protein RecO [Cetobacterium ceti]